MKNQSTKPNHESIAIVGMSCRFPGAATLDDFWNLLKDGKDTITEISKERWDADKYFDLDPNAERKTHQRHASLLSNIHHFDPLFFNISPAEAIEMSPSQKLMLELAWEAIENSSIPYQNVQGKNVSVYVGNIWTDFEHFRKQKNAKATLHSAVGMSSNVVANRVSFAFGLTGPSLVVDTGCSASLVALHLACQGLLNGESELSMVGGINHILDPDKYIELTQFGGLSHKGKCSTFDKDADGFVRGEGGGVLLLKRLSEAERDGDKVYAIIRGTAVNNNGYNDTLPATSTEGQKSLLETAYRAANIKPHEVHYVEAHGTGTKLGDPNEARAIGEFFLQGRSKNKLRVGSVKTNIGHTEATAGIAGIVKVALAMKHHTLPPNLNFNTPNPDIAFDDLKLEVQKDLGQWPVSEGETYKAGVNSFGWGGTNAHVVLEEFRPVVKNATPVQVTSYSLPLSAKSSQSLVEYAKVYANLLARADGETFDEVVIATALRKPDFDHRYLFTGSTRDELLLALQEFVKDETEVSPTPALKAKDKMVFVFPGQGGQWLGMGQQLFSKELVFKKTIEACDKAFSSYTDWSLTEQLNASAATSRLTEINVIQPAIFAMQVALARLWMSWGIQPQAVVGHSMGEVAAAHIAGVLNLDDAARIICTRSILMKTVAGKGGAMAVTELTREEAEKLAAAYPSKLSVAVNNSPKSTVLAGDKASIDKVLAELESKGLFCRLVKVDVASHSPQMEPLKEPLRVALEGIVPQKAVIPFISTVKDKFMEGTDMGADYWTDNLRGMVQFASVVNQLIKENHTVFLEANPHPVLVNAVNECAEASRKKLITVASLYREKPETEELLKNLGDLYCKGLSIDWRHFYNTSAIPTIDLPPYPFQREQYELEDLSQELSLQQASAVKYPLLGSKINLANITDTFYWESSLSVSKFPYLKDHIVHGKIRVPASCYIELALEAISEIFQGNSPVQLEGLHFTTPVWLGENERADIQTKLGLIGDGKAELSIFKKHEGGWTLLASGFVTKDVRPFSEKVFEQIEYHEPAYVEGINYYKLLQSIGLSYGSSFHQITGLDKIKLNNNPHTNILFSIKADSVVKLTAEKYKVHPALISAFLQPIFGQLTAILEEGGHLNVAFEHIDELVYQHPVNYNHELRGLLVFHAPRRNPENKNSWMFHADIVIANIDNTPVISFKGIRGTASSKSNENHSGGKKSQSGFLETFAELNSDIEKVEALQQMITHHVSKIIKTPATRIKKTMTFKGMGVDSLMAVQLRNQLEKEMSLKLPVGMFWSHPSIQDYSLYLNDLLAAQLQGAFDKVKKPHKETVNNWFIRTKPNPHAAYRLFCFHDAGGSASLFDGWENLLDESLIDVVLIELPGRGRRLEEAPYTHHEAFLTDFVPELMKLLDKPYVFLGHSMGGLLAFEVIRKLREAQAALPQKLFISSTSGLNAYDKRQVDYTLSNEELVSMYPHLEMSVIGDEELQTMLIDMLRADLQFLHEYQYTYQQPLDIPIIAIHGNDDERVKREQMEEWAKETASTFRLLDREGGHRYIQHDAAFVTQLIQEEIQATNHSFIEK